MKINNHSTIAILMATYNGAKYLREQIDSIINQSCSDWALYIQDDGSRDETIDIIKSYQDERVKLVDVGLSRQGAGMNFMSLLNMVDSEYYMFCDQDDVWFPDKIEKSLTRMREEENKYGKETPIIVHTDRMHVNADLSVRMKSEFNPRGISQDRLASKINQLKHPDILAIYTIVGGCTMMFNKAVKKIAFPFLNIRVHDSFVQWLWLITEELSVPSQSRQCIIEFTRQTHAVFRMSVFCQRFCTFSIRYQRICGAIIYGKCMVEAVS